jgi:hypothetical protein
MKCRIVNHLVVVAATLLLISSAWATWGTSFRSLGTTPTRVTKRGAQSPPDMWTGSFAQYADNCTAPGLGSYLSGHGNCVARHGPLRIWM